MEISSFRSKNYYLTMSHARSGRQVRRTPSVINNYPGTARPNLPNQITAAPEYAPHLPSHGDGLEEWLIAVEGIVDGNENPLLSARWSHGDSASLHPRLENGVLDFWTTFGNGTAWGFSLNGTLVYSDVRGVKTWAIGGNNSMGIPETGVTL